MLATFFPDASTTFYSVRLLDPAPGDTAWSYEFTPPAEDPTCNKLEAYAPGITRTTYSLRWAHHADDGCNHAGTEHLGRITVTAQSGSYECRATITGTTSHEGPQPDPCFKLPSTPPPPSPPSASAPSIRELEKKQWGQASVAATAASVTYAGIAVGCALVPEPASKAVTVLGIVVAGGYLALGVYYHYKSEDPPDKNYKRLARFVIPKLPPVGAGSGVTAAEAAAVNAFQANVARIGANDAAFITSFERAQGAYAARDGSWDRRQSRAAAAFARAEAKLLEALPGLEAALRRAVARASVRPLPRSAVRKGLDDVGERGLPPRFSTTAKRLGVSAAAITAFTKQVSRAKPATIAGPVEG